jgi:intracellular multiplication protein IcmD
MNRGQLFKTSLYLLLIPTMFWGLDALAAVTQTISGVAGSIAGNLSAVAKLITAGSYVAGFGFAIGGLVKLKAHKDNPTQVHISQGVVLLFVGAALMFAPTVFKTTGNTMFGVSGGVTGGPSGTATF